MALFSTPYFYSAVINNLVTNFCHRDSFNITPASNTDGRLNCLRQPGQLDNQPLMSMLVTSIHLLNLVCRD